jgi:radical SAM superfamily enzyme YgiQ (UPF0313 family)
VQIGVESGNPEILKLIKKGITIRQVEEACKLAYKEGLEVKNYFILGHPTETIGTINDTIKLMNKQEALDWISSTSNYYSESADFRKEGNILYFDNGYIVDLSNYSVHIYNSMAHKWIMPKSIFYNLSRGSPIPIITMFLIL